MAMSDWDCLAYGPDGRCCGGTFSILGIEGGISKRRLWAKPAAGEGPCLSTYEGRADYGPISVCACIPGTPAARDMDATFFLIRGWDLNASSPVCWAGIGSSSYDDPIPRMLKHLELDGVVDPEACSLVWELGGWEDEDGNEVSMFHVAVDWGRYPCTELWDELDFRIPIDEARELKLDAQYRGITPELVAEFHAWLVAEMGTCHLDEERAWLDAVLAAEPLRFNQGDAFLVGTDASMTAVGEAHGETACSGLVRNLADEGRLPDITAP